MTVRIIQGDCRTMLATLPAASVNCIVTSPPYYGLRDYGTAQWEGGDLGCDHSAKNPSVDARTSTLGSNRIGLAESNTAYQHGKVFRHICAKCGARRTDQQIGLEQTPDAYVAEMVAVFREAKRVLRDDGTLWLNIGDSYSGGGGFSPNAPSNRCGSKQTTQGSRVYKGRQPTSGLKPKDLLMIPARVALALQADGWWLRSEIVWSKPNPVPESVRDRPTSAHEKVYLFAKSGKPTVWQALDTLEWSNAPDLTETVLDADGEPQPRWRGQSYYYDADAVKERAVYSSEVRVATPKNVNGLGLKPTRPYGHKLDGYRNLRNVWTITPEPFEGAHFAVFAPALVEPCIKAGCPVGGTVLDPFAGSGTTGLVADRLGRNAVLIELNPAYAAMASNRLANDAGMFAMVAAE